MAKSEPLPDIVIANIHKRYTGVSATVKALAPHMVEESVAYLDTGELGLPSTMPFWTVARRGWQKTPSGKPRIWHARRDVEMLAGIFLRDVLRQNWRLVFTSAAPKRPGKMLRWLINRMDAVITTSTRSAGFLDWHSTIINHGVDVEAFTPPDDKAQVFGQSGLPGRYAIGIFGRVRPSKGTDLFVDAMVDLLPDYPDFTAFITGLSKTSQDDFQQAMTTKINDANLTDRIVFLGDLDNSEIHTWFQRTSLCVAASRSEGFGLTPLEAMASGAAAVTSGAGFWPELIREGINGALFETGDVESLKAALTPFLDNPEKLSEIGKNAREYVVKNHSIEVEAHSIASVYKGLADKVPVKMSR